jgi:LysM repeat protein
MATNLYNPNTGALLSPGQSVVNNATGQTITQGTPYVPYVAPASTPVSTPVSSGSSGSSSAQIINYNPNNGALLTPGQVVLDNSTGKYVQQGTIFGTNVAAPTSASPTVTSSSYTIKNGDNLSTIAANNGTTVAALMAANPSITNPNLIQAGASLKIPTGSLGSAVSTGNISAGTDKTAALEAINTQLTTAQNKLAQAKALGYTEGVDFIYDAAGNLVAPKTAEDLGLVTDKNNKVITSDQARKDLLASLALSATPTVPNFTSIYSALRSSEGLDGLSSQISSIKTQIADITASMTKGVYNAEGALAPMELIGTRQTAIQRQANEQLTSLTSALTTLTDSYNSKLDTVKTLMDLQNTDYTNAVNSYNSQYSQAIQVQQLLATQEEKAAAEENAVRDDARANLEIIINSSKDSGKTFSTLDPALQTQLKQLEIKAGLPSGFTAYFMNTKPGAELVTSGVGYDSSDKQFVYMMYKDPVTGEIKTSNVYTGGVKDGGSVNASTVKFTAEDRKKLANTGMNNGQIDILQSYLNQNGKNAEVDAVLGQYSGAKAVLNTILSGTESSVTLTEDFFKTQYSQITDPAEQKKLIEEQGVGSMFTSIGIEFPKAVDKAAKTAMASVEAYRKAGYSDTDILKMLQK